MTAKAIIAAGHDVTAAAAAEVIAAGGNAFDGACAALAAAAVAEPVLASLGGGGFVMGRPAGSEPFLLDFFVQTPQRPASGPGLDFYPVVADFGDTTQTFHIGWGSIATPGAIAGLCALQQCHARLPLADLLAPAARAARAGVVVTAFQHRLARIVEPILRADPDYFAAFAAPHDPQRLAEPGERVQQPLLAEALAAIADAGASVLYRGPWADGLASQSHARGGLLSAADLAGYQVAWRQPLARSFRGARLFLNPSPSFGGVLIALAAELLQQGSASHLAGSLAHYQRLALAMALTQEARAEVGARLPEGLPAELVAAYHDRMREQLQVRRGTTQISIADRDGNLASLTLSNGEGSGALLPGTGIMLNNMLGEADLNPGGITGFVGDRRMSSMMCPTLVRVDAGNGPAGVAPGWTVTGSAGSNRIRSAILQVLSNLIELRMPLADAVEAPRLHLEDGLLSVEPPIDGPVLDQLRRDWPAVHPWSQRSVFFGGAHSVAIRDDGRLDGAGDSRRGGVVRRV